MNSFADVDIQLQKFLSNVPRMRGEIIKTELARYRVIFVGPSTTESYDYEVYYYEIIDNLKGETDERHA